MSASTFRCRKYPNEKDLGPAGLAARAYTLARASALAVVRLEGLGENGLNKIESLILTINFDLLIAG